MIFNKNDMFEIYYNKLLSVHTSEYFTVYIKILSLDSGGVHWQKR